MSRTFGYKTQKIFKTIQKIFKTRPVKALTFAKKSSGGRCNTGRITSFHRGGGCKRLYRKVDFCRLNPYPGVIRRLEYDPNRTSYIAVVCYENGELGYILATKNMKVGDLLSPIDTKILREGNKVELKLIPTGARINSISFSKNKSAFVRSAGVSAKLLQHRSDGFSVVRLPSKEHRLFHSTDYAVIGDVSNAAHRYTKLNKAGVARRLGRRPIVRGLAMNPIDHPHGGGDTKGRHPCSPWGQLAKGFRTVKTRRFLIVKPRFFHKKKKKRLKY